MKKKSRTPPPPQTVQYPRARKAPKKPRNLRGWVTGGAAVLTVGGLGLGLVLAFTGGDGGIALKEKLLAQGCALTSPSVQTGNHVAQTRKGFEYSSFPATSGPHSPQPALWNPYDRPVSEINVIHNLEHSGIVLQYGDETRPETEQLIREWYLADPNGVIVAPLPELGSRIALRAWGRLATCTRFSKEALSAFRDTYRSKGPEPFPAELLKPGT